MPPPSPCTRRGASSAFQALCNSFTSRPPARAQVSEVDFEALEAGGCACGEADGGFGDAVVVGEEFDGGLVGLAFYGGGADIQLEGAVVEGFYERALTAVRFDRRAHRRHLYLLSFQRLSRSRRQFPHPARHLPHPPRSQHRP